MLNRRDRLLTRRSNGVVGTGEDTNGASRKSAIREMFRWPRSVGSDLTLLRLADSRPSETVENRSASMIRL